MPTTYKFVLTTWLDGTSASEGIQITPTFHHKLVSPDLNAMAEDLLDGWNSWMGATVRDTQQRVTIYDIQGARPNYPKHMEQRNSDVAKVAGANREVALCLTGYSDNNRPRFRGRLYIPMCLAGVAPTGSNANVTARQKVADLVPLFEGLGGVDWDWGVYSRVDQQFRKYTHWYVDDAWDTQRSRGKKATARTTGSTSG